MTTANHGPACTLPRERLGIELDASFRMISWYDGGTDMVFTRLDAKINSVGGDRGDQFNVCLSSTPPEVSDLVTPTKGGVLGCVAIKVSAADLVQNLRDLADSVEHYMKAPA